MKRTYKYALTVVLGLGVASVAFGQDGFPDVKDTHWAADSVNRLKLTGLIHGDSDGKFNGDRTMTRYEVATILYAVYNKLVGFNADVEKNLRALEAKVNSMKAPEQGPNIDLTDVKSAIADLQREVGSMKSWSADLAQLKKMLPNYAQELKSLGQDVDDMKKKVTDISSRVSKLEKGPGGVQISGDMNTWMASTSPSAGSTVVFDQDGRFLPTSSTAAGFNPLIMLHELGVKFADPTANVPFKAEVVIGNSVTDGRNLGGFGSQTWLPSQIATPIFSGDETVYISEATAMYKPMNLLVGRQGVMLNKFIMRRPDNTWSFDNERWDNHKYSFDGANMGLFSDKVHVFTGTTNNVINSAGGNVQPLFSGGLPVERIFGATADFSFGGDKGKVQASWVNFDGSIGFNPFVAKPLGETGPPPPPSGTTRYNVYGADASYNFGAVQAEIGGGKSTAIGIPEQTNAAQPMISTLVDTANSRWDASLSSKNDRFGWKLAYRSVEINYFAPGDWGRVGILRNLNDTRAVTASAMLKATDKLHLHGWYERGDAIQGPGDYTTWRAGLGYQLTPKWMMDFMYDDAKFRNGYQGFAANTESKFSTVTLGYDLGEKTMLNLFVQNSDLKNVINAANKGYFYGMNFSVKF